MSHNHQFIRLLLSLSLGYFLLVTTFFFQYIYSKNKLIYCESNMLATWLKTRNYNHVITRKLTWRIIIGVVIAHIYHFRYFPYSPFK